MACSPSAWNGQDGPVLTAAWPYSANANENAITGFINSGLASCLGSPPLLFPQSYFLLSFILAVQSKLFSLFIGRIFRTPCHSILPCGTTFKKNPITLFVTRDSTASIEHYLISFSWRKVIIFSRFYLLLHFKVYLKLFYLRKKLNKFQNFFFFFFCRDMNAPRKRGSKK